MLYPVSNVLQAIGSGVVSCLTSDLIFARPGKDDKEQLDLIAKTGTIIEFMDAYVELEETYTKHRFTLAQTRRSDAEFEQNACPK